MLKVRSIRFEFTLKTTFQEIIGLLNCIKTCFCHISLWTTLLLAYFSSLILIKHLVKILLTQLELGLFFDTYWPRPFLTLSRIVHLHISASGRSYKLYLSTKMTGNITFGGVEHSSKALQPSVFK